MIKHDAYHLDKTGNIGASHQAAGLAKFFCLFLGLFLSQQLSGGGSRPGAGMFFLCLGIADLPVENFVPVDDRYGKSYWDH